MISLLRLKANYSSLKLVDNHVTSKVKCRRPVGQQLFLGTFAE
ncbi:hypothetical protein HMPREF1872_00376 [Amygdalobacter nucleatus]|uniref:Uncharacterized protein n=1 Tax=Amygdalobacter nucleatus TaxID=3029274 RepID=A0A133YG72_9FIRM|nr:hypothetical protein HMPREF1872_00376 [Amygdalobacter nucleatus]